MIQHFSLALLLPSITIFHPLLETPMFQRAVTFVNIFLKVFIFFKSHDWVIASAEAALLLWSRTEETTFMLENSSTGLCTMPFFGIYLLQAKSKTHWSQYISGVNSSVAFVCALL